MIGSVRRFPFFGLILFALGFFVASALAGTASSVVGIALFLPFLMFKIFLFMLFFGVLVRFFGRGWGGPGPGRWRGEWERPHRWEHQGARREEGRWSYRGVPYSPAPPRSPEQHEWDEHLRQARREVDDLDAPYDDLVADGPDEGTGDGSATGGGAHQ